MTKGRIGVLFIALLCAVAALVSLSLVFGLVGDGRTLYAVLGGVHAVVFALLAIGFVRLRQWAREGYLWWGVIAAALLFFDVGPLRLGVPPAWLFSAIFLLLPAVKKTFGGPPLGNVLADMLPDWPVLTLARKEIRQIFLSPIAYAFLLAFVFFVTFMFFRTFFLVGETTMAGFFDLFPIAFAVVIPGVTMRMWAEERKQGTIEFLLTSPIETWHIVASKFLGGLTLIALCLLLTIGTPITVASYGSLDPGPVWGGYIGALLMGGACIAIAMFLSAFTQDQIVSFLAGVIVLLALVLLGHPLISSEFGPGSWFGVFARTVSLTTHFESIGRGVIDLRDVYYFVATIALFLYLNARVIDLRRWR